MARVVLKKISFVSKGFAAVLNSSGMDAAVAAQARKQAQLMEQSTGEAYRVERLANASSRVVYTAKPEGEDGSEGRRKIDHETWVKEVWPKVGGPKWRPHS